jgi:hypothetical protein
MDDDDDKVVKLGSLRIVLFSAMFFGKESGESNCRQQSFRGSETIP